MVLNITTRLVTKNVKTYLPIILGFTVLVAGALYMKSKPEVSPNSVPDHHIVKAANFIDVFEVGNSTHEYHIDVSGRLKPRTTLKLAAEVSGKITYVNPKVKVGGKFKRGETLVRVNPVSFQADLEIATAELSSAEAILNQAQNDLDRANKLYAHSETVHQADT